jgi:uncharacterized protein YjdB
MKNYFKKFSIMFVMSLVLVFGSCVSALADDNGVVGTANLSNTAKNSAKIGDRLTLPEIGWKRYDDTHSSIKYTEGFISFKDSSINYNSTRHAAYNSTNKTEYIKFSFYGTKLRLIDFVYNNRTQNSKISFDGGQNESCSAYGNNSLSQSVFYEKIDLEKKIHNVVIEAPYEGNDKGFLLDAIDIDDTGYLVNSNESILLDKSTMNLTEGNSGQLIATTPADTQVTWTTSDSSIATVDSNGKVTGIKEGTCTITATTPNGLTATCTVTVTKKVIPDNSGMPTNNQGTTNSYGILNLNTPSGFNQNNNNGGNGNSSNNSGNNNNSGNSGNNYSNNNNSNSNNNYYYYNNYYLSFNTKA